MDQQQQCSLLSAQFWVGRGPGQGQLQLAEKGIPEADHHHDCHRRRCRHRRPQFHHRTQHRNQHLYGDDDWHCGQGGSLIEIIAMMMMLVKGIRTDVHNDDDDDGEVF